MSKQVDRCRLICRTHGQKFVALSIDRDITVLGWQLLKVPINVGLWPSLISSQFPKNWLRGQFPWLMLAIKTTDFKVHVPSMKNNSGFTVLTHQEYRNPNPFDCFFTYKLQHQHPRTLKKTPLLWGLAKVVKRQSTPNAEGHGQAALGGSARQNVVPWDVERRNCRGYLGIFPSTMVIKQWGNHVQPISSTIWLFNGLPWKITIYNR